MKWQQRNGLKWNGHKQNCTSCSVCPKANLITQTHLIKKKKNVSVSLQVLRMMLFLRGDDSISMCFQCLCLIPLYRPIPALESCVVNVTHLNYLIYPGVCRVMMRGCRCYVVSFVMCVVLSSQCVKHTVVYLTYTHRWDSHLCATEQGGEITGSCY